MPAQHYALPLCVHLHGSRSSVDFSLVAWGELLMLLGPLGPPAHFDAWRALLLGAKQQWLSVLAGHAKSWQHVSMASETLACAHSPCPVPLPAVLWFAITCHKRRVGCIDRRRTGRRGKDRKRQGQEARASAEGQEACHLKGRLGSSGCSSRRIQRPRPLPRPSGRLR